MRDTFTIRLTGYINGEEIHPGTLDITDLLKLLEGLSGAIKRETAEDHGSSTNKTRLLSLESILDKCSEMTIKYTSPARHGCSRIENALCFGSMESLQEESQGKLRKSFNRLIAKGANLQWIGEHASPVYSKENPLPVAKGIGTFNELSASLLARVLKIGGENDAAIRAVFDATGQEMSAKCSVSVCKKMSDAGCLYENVSLLGKVKWQVSPWKIATFNVKGFEKHYQGKSSDFWTTLDDKFTAACDSIDIDKHMDDMRGEETT